MISHELRTPLAVIPGASEVIALNQDLPSHFAEPLRRIETATTDMFLALDQLLALARENEGALKEWVARRPMIDNAVSSAKIRYPKGAITVSINIYSGAAVVIHPTSLKLVINNLVGNCFQHVENGELVVEFEGTCLSISDDGPGLETATNPWVPFARGGTSMGSGLGLDISRRQCDAAGIVLTTGGSKGGRGTHFRLTSGEARN